MKLILDTGEVYNMVPAVNEKMENEIQLYVGGVRYVGEVVDDEILFREFLIKQRQKLANEDGNLLMPEIIKKPL